MSARSSSSFDILVRGAGIIGLSCALELADRGANVALIDPVWPPRGASWAAAGMIAPAFEAASLATSHKGLFELCLLSAQCWPEWSERLQARTGLATGYDPRASRAVAVSDSDIAALERVKTQLTKRDLPFRELASAELIGSARNGLELPTDTQVDNRMSMNALIEACETHERVTIVQTAKELIAETVLVTAGWESSGALPIDLPIFPLSGQMISIERGDSDPEVPIRCGSLYIAPKADRIIIGATVERGIARSRVDEKSLSTLLMKAAVLYPQFADRNVLEKWVGIRPGTPDHAPYLGRVAERLFVAAGHHRNGILLAPITAKIMADLILEGRGDEKVAAFSPVRDAALTHR